MNTQKYYFHDLWDLCTYHIEHAQNKTNKIYDLCVGYWNNGSQMSDTDKQLLLDYFNN